MAFLFARLLPDIGGKPLHEDEAVAGLISARPLGDLLHTVVLDRGGAPLHFLLAHVALAIDTTPESLRWLSLVFALATVPVCYDLTRRLAGRSAGLIAAALTATSQLLLVYGTFGRMYSLFAFASALAADLFVRALERPQRREVLAAAAAALLPLTVHPFGAFLFGAEAAVALWLWRGRTLRGALPVLALTLLALPLLLADLRLSDRYAPEAGQDLDSGTSAGSATLHALGGAAGGRGALLAVFVLLAAAGIFAVARRRPAVAAFAALTIAVPPVVLAVASAAGIAGDRLAPRHLIFMLPVWIALVAIGATQLGAMLPPKARVAALAAIVAAAALAPNAVSEPRTIPTGAPESCRGTRRLARNATRSRRRAVSLFACFLRRASGCEGGARILSRARRACARCQANGRNADGLHLDPAARAPQWRSVAKSGSPVPGVPLVAHPRVTRPVRERNRRARISGEAPESRDPNRHGTECACVRGADPRHGVRRAGSTPLCLLAGRHLNGWGIAPEVLEPVVGT